MTLDEVIDCKKKIHPNRITAYSLGMTASGIGLMTLGPSYDLAGLGLIAAGYLMDNVDGRVARSLNLQTSEGSRLDSFIDKVKTFSVGTYILTLSPLETEGILFPAAMLTNFCIDAISFSSRGNVAEQLRESYRAVRYPETCTKEEKTNPNKANMWGKVKAAIQYGVGTTYLALEVAKNHDIDLPIQVSSYAPAVFTTALAVSGVLGSIGIVQRLKKKKSRLENF